MTKLQYAILTPILDISKYLIKRNSYSNNYLLRMTIQNRPLNKFIKSDLHFNNLALFNHDLSENVLGM